MILLSPPSKSKPSVVIFLVRHQFLLLHLLIICHMIYIVAFSCPNGLQWRMHLECFFVWFQSRQGGEPWGSVDVWGRKCGA